MQLHSIGVIRSPFTEPAGMPIQPAGAGGARGRVELVPDYAEGLADLDGFSHIYLLYAFHRSQGFQLTVTPFLDTHPRGLFATRAPRRPNPLGLSVVELERIDGPVLYVRNIDVLDGTPLLDLKPYVPQFDSVPDARAGWLDHSNDTPQTVRADRRFADHA